MSNKVNPELTKIFKRGSRTYFFSSIFFPPNVRKEVTELYSFVRVADDYVDQVPADVEGFKRFKNLSLSSLSTGADSGDVVIDTFFRLAKRRSFMKEWVEAFLNSMESDLTKKRYDTLAELEVYIYGSAEVVGLMMSQILGLPEEAHPFACSLGKAMQYINFLRDVKADIELGRQYLPTTELRSFNLETLTPSVVATSYDDFKLFVSAQVKRYLEWQSHAEAGYRYIPKRYLIPIRTAAEMYKWTAKQVEAAPELIFVRKIKPSKTRIIFSGSRYALSG
jgi:15-cis-phytoene synthase